MASSTHWLGTAAAMSVLERGGNAFDAAVAGGFVLQVVESHMNGLGGEVPIVLWSDRDREVRIICGQGPAPMGSTISAFHNIGLTAVPGDGLLPAVVPGAFGAWMLLLREYGTMNVREVMDYAISYAGGGFSVSPGLAQRIALVSELFRDDWHESARVYLVGGRPTAGSVFKNPILAETYRRIVKESEAAGGSRERQIDAATRAFYNGFVADTIDRYLARNDAVDMTGERHRGLLTGQDMSQWHASLESPVSVTYRDFTVYKPGPWSQAPVFLQQLTLLDGFNLEEMGWLSSDYIHTVVECAKLAFADRDAWYGDPAFSAVPLEQLLSRSYAAERKTLVGASASLELRPGAPNGKQPRLPNRPQHLPLVRGHSPGESQQSLNQGGQFTTHPGNVSDTVHIDVADRNGNIVSCTPSGGWLQSSPCISGLGFCLTTRGQLFNLTEGHPNSLQPLKRPRTTLSPTLAFRAGEPYLAFGTPGGDQQDQWALSFFIAHTTFGFDLATAVDAPLFYSAHFPSSFYPYPEFAGQVRVEERLQSRIIAELERRGHIIHLDPPWSMGRVTAVAFDRQLGLLKAAASPRGLEGYAAGR